MTTEQMVGLVTGILFGFLLQKGRALRFEKQVGGTALSGYDHCQVHVLRHFGGNGGNHPSLPGGGHCLEPQVGQSRGSSRGWGSLWGRLGSSRFSVPAPLWGLLEKGDGMPFSA